MRLFVSLPLDDGIRRHLSGVMRKLAAEFPDVRWVRAENLHITLKFLGEVPDRDVPGITAALKRVSVHGPLTIRAERLAVHPRRRLVHLIAAEFGGDVGAISLLRAAMETCLEELNVAREKRELWCHATLGRCRAGIELEGWADAHEELTGLSGLRWPGPASEINTFQLVSSTLRQEGPLYVPVATFPLTP